MDRDDFAIDFLAYRFLYRVGVSSFEQMPHHRLVAAFVDRDVFVQERKQTQRILRSIADRLVAMGRGDPDDFETIRQQQRRQGDRVIGTDIRIKDYFFSLHIFHLNYSIALIIMLK